MLDDESDYFSIDNQWLSDKERSLLRKRDEQIRESRFASRLEKRKVNLDFAGT